MDPSPQPSARLRQCVGSAALLGRALCILKLRRAALILSTSNSLFVFASYFPLQGHRLCACHLCDLSLALKRAWALDECQRSEVSLTSQPVVVFGRKLFGVVNPVCAGGSSPEICRLALAPITSPQKDHANLAGRRQ